MSTHLSFQTYAQTTLPLEVVDWKNFTAEFYHLKLQNLNVS